MWLEWNPNGKWDSFATPCKQVMCTVEFAPLKTIAAQAHRHCWVFIFLCKEQRFISTIYCSPFNLLLLSCINNSCFVFHQRFQTPRNNKSTLPTASCFHQFLRVWNLWWNTRTRCWYDLLKRPSPVSNQLPSVQDTNWNFFFSHHCTCRYVHDCKYLRPLVIN